MFTIDAGSPPLVRAFDREWPVYADGGGKWRALIGIDLETKPARYTVTFTSGTRRLAYPLLVQRRAFPTRRLTVDPALVNPPPAAIERIDRENREMNAIWRSPAEQRLWRGAFTAPVPEAPNSSFGTRSILNGEMRSPHNGTDFPSPEGREIKAPNGGRVVIAGSRYYTGNTIVIDHGLGLFSLFAHMSEMRVKIGDTVTAGDVIGTVGATGRVTGPHLHWMVRLNGARVDPLSLLYVLGPER